MRQRFFQFLHFSKKERTGTLALLLLCLLVFSVPAILRRLQPARSTDFSDFNREVQVFKDSIAAQKALAEPQLFPFNPNTATQEDFERLGLSKKVAAGICKYRDKGGQFRKPEDFGKIWGLAEADFERLLPFIQMENTRRDFPEKPAGKKAPEQFAFDPNTASEADFKRLGIPPWTIKSILNYRSKGGKFRQKKDLEKIYNLSEADYERLEPFITIGTPATEPGKTPAYAASAPKWPAKKAIDINLAGVEEWTSLPGIGEKRALQMIKYRDKLGGFLSIDQVAQMYNLPDSVFQKIRPLLVLEHREIRKINLNSVTVTELAAHPYFSQKQATLIINYRLQHGPYRSLNELDNIIPFTDKTWLAKVKEYLAVL